MAHETVEGRGVGNEFGFSRAAAVYVRHTKLVWSWPTAELPDNGSCGNDWGHGWSNLAKIKYEVIWPWETHSKAITQASLYPGI